MGKSVILYSAGNHSCEPNAEVTFPYNNSTLALKALHSIQPGEVRNIWKENGAC